MNEKIKNKDADEAEDRRLDEGLDETFPASDPPASTQPGDGGPDEEKKQEKPSRRSGAGKR